MKSPLFLGVCNENKRRKIAGIKGVFLIQNIFPTTESYVQEEYLRRGQEIRVSKIIQREILEKAKNVIALANRGIVATYTNLPEFIKEIEMEIIIRKRNLSKLYSMMIICNN